MIFTTRIKITKVIKIIPLSKKKREREKIEYNNKYPKRI